MDQHYFDIVHGSEDVLLMSTLVAVFSLAGLKGGKAGSGPRLCSRLSC